MIAPGSLTSDSIRRRLDGRSYVLLLLATIASMLAYGAWRTFMMVGDTRLGPTPMNWRSGATVQVTVYAAVIALVALLAPLHRHRRQYVAGATCVALWLVAMDPRVWRVAWLVQADDPLTVLVGVVFAVVSEPRSLWLPLGWWLLGRSVGGRAWHVGAAIYLLAGLLTGGVLGWSFEMAIRPELQSNVPHPGMLALSTAIFHGLLWHDLLFKALGLEWPHLPIQMF